MWSSRTSLVRGTGRTGEGSRCDQVVWTIRTEQPAWCAHRLDTLPSRNRRAPCMPRLPITRRSASISSQYESTASAGSPASTCVRHVRPGLLRDHLGRVRAPAPCSRCSPDPTRSMRRPCRGRRAPGRRGAAITMWSAAPVSAASDAAWLTALVALAEPSVPTTIDVYMRPPVRDSCTVATPHDRGRMGSRSGAPVRWC